MVGQVQPRLIAGKQAIVPPPWDEENLLETRQVRWNLFSLPSTHVISYWN